MELVGYSPCGEKRETFYFVDGSYAGHYDSTGTYYEDGQKISNGRESIIAEYINKVLGLPRLGPTQKLWASFERFASLERIF
jgi:hypothetical protein